MPTKFREPSWRRSHLDDSSVEGIFGLESDCMKKEVGDKLLVGVDSEEARWTRQMTKTAERRRTCTVTAITITPLFPQVQRWGRTVVVFLFPQCLLAE